MRVIEKTVFLFDELSDAAREYPQDAEIQRQNSYQIRGSVSANDRYMRTRVDAYWADDRDEDDANQVVSDERVDETIRANEYEFDEDGKPA